MSDGKVTALTGGDPVITSRRKGTLYIEWPLKSIGGSLLIDLDERKIKMELKSEKSADWFLDLVTADKKELPFKNISRSKIDCSFDGFEYAVKASGGAFVSSDFGSGFKIYPKNNQIILKLSK